MTTERRAAKGRKRHPADAARILSVGLSASTSLVLVAAMVMAAPEHQTPVVDFVAGQAPTTQPITPTTQPTTSTTAPSPSVPPTTAQAAAGPRPAVRAVAPRPTTVVRAATPAPRPVAAARRPTTVKPAKTSGS